MLLVIRSSEAVFLVFPIYLFFIACLSYCEFLLERVLVK